MCICTTRWTHLWLHTTSGKQRGGETTTTPFTAILQGLSSLDMFFCGCYGPPENINTTYVEPISAVPTPCHLRSVFTCANGKGTTTDLCTCIHAYAYEYTGMCTHVQLYSYIYIYIYIFIYCIYICEYTHLHVLDSCARLGHTNSIQLESMAHLQGMPQNSIEAHAWSIR